MVFLEAGQLGKGKIEWKKNILPHLSLVFASVKQELAQKELAEDKKNNITKMLQEQKGSAAYSMTFLKWLDKLVKLLKKDTIGLNLRDDHPFKATLKVRELGKAEIVYSLANRPEQAEFEEDEDEDENIDELDDL